MSILYSSPSTKAAVIVLLVVSCSTVRHMWRPTSEYLNKNVINEYVVKLSWGWSLSCIIPILAITSALYNEGRVLAIVFQFGRVLVASMIWYTNTAVMFHLIHRNHGDCSDPSITDYASCRWHGYQWDGFDVSGHAFLLTYCILVINEEFISSERVYLYFHYDNKLKLAHDKGLISKERQVYLRSIRNKINPLVVVLRGVAVVEILTWLVNVVITSLFYHTWVEKVLGCMMGVVYWYITYKVLYDYTPLSTSYGQLNPLHGSRKN